MGTSGARTRPTKVDRVIERYGIEGTGDELERRWTGETEEQYSLRELAHWFNRRVLAAAVEASGRSPLDGEIENTYRLLSDDDVSEGMRTQTRNQLERDGVDVDEVRSDFVSHQAIYTYLKQERGAEYKHETRDQLEKDRATINRLQSRLVAVVDDALGRSKNTERITLGEYDVLSDTQVFCSDCGGSYAINELFDRGGCDCDPGHLQD